MQIRDDVQRQWKKHRSLLRRLLPCAIIEHVGSTAVPGSLTKGDLDIQVRVPAERFSIAEALLARHYRRNARSTHSESFAAFEDFDGVIPLGVQLTAIDGEFDIFWKFREVLLIRPDLNDVYEILKLNHEGKEMSSYRDAKEGFFDMLRRTPEYEMLGAESHPR
jgi:GrpB-like predicted nucleotidyltransferase (UPF0157 family)